MPGAASAGTFYLISAATDGVLRLWSLSSLVDHLLQADTAHSAMPLLPLCCTQKVHQNGVTAISTQDVRVHQPSGAAFITVLTGGDDQAVALTRFSIPLRRGDDSVVGFATAETVAFPSAHVSAIRGLACSDCGRYVFSTGYDQVLNVWRVCDQGADHKAAYIAHSDVLMDLAVLKLELAASCAVDVADITALTVLNVSRRSPIPTDCIDYEVFIVGNGAQCIRVRIPHKAAS